MAAELRAELTASIKDLEAKLSKAEKIIQGYGKEVDRQGTKGQKGFNKVGKGAANALPATQEFSRVIQDLPFGIQGVGNNLQQLTANFGNLSKQTGGAKAAIGAMISSLSGPAGMLLAVSVVTSALTFFANNGLLKAKTAAEKLAEAQNKAAESIQKYRDSIVGVNKARLEGNIGAAKELVNLRTLKKQVEDTALSQELREDGIDQLISKYPTYFKELDREKILNGQLQTSYDSLTNSILKRARATAASNLIIRNTEKQLTLENQLENLNEEIAKGDQKRSEARNKFNKSTEKAYLFGINPAAQNYNKELSKGNNLLEEQAELQKQIGEITKENAKLDTIVEANLVVDPNIKLKDAGKTGEKISKAVSSVQIPNNILDNLFAITPEAQANLTKGSVDAVSKVSNAINAELQKQNSNPIGAYLSNIEQALVDFNANANEIISVGIANTFAGIGEGIGAALAEGGNIFDSIGKSLLNSLGGVLVQLGQLAIQTGVGLLAVKTALKTLNPFVAIAAGVALVGIGSTFSNATKNIGGSFGGGGAVGGQGSRSTGNSFSGGGNFGTSSTSGGRVVFEISGQKLIGVLNNTLDGNRRLGGNISLG